MSDVGSLGPDEGSILLGKARALEKTKLAVTDTYRAKGVDITAAEIASVSTLLLQLGSVDVAEVFVTATIYGGSSIARTDARLCS